MKARAALLLARDTCRCVALVLLTVAALTGGARAEEDESPVSRRTLDVTEDRNWFVFPVVASSPETGVQLGAMLMRFIPWLSWELQASRLEVMAYGTTKGQSSFSISPSLFLGDGKYRLYSVAAIEPWPANFYGIGNDTPDTPERYDLTNTLFDAVLERRLSQGWVGGIVYTARTEDMAPEPGGLLDTGGITGASGGTYGGLGIRLGFDSRDNTNAPYSGSVVRYQGLVFDPSLGSDLDFRIQRLSLRGYHTSSRGNTLAAAATVRLARGDVPFRYLSTPDGTFVLRGIEKRRYIDNDLLALQAEYRLHTRGVWGMTFFACLAQVTPRIEDVREDRFKSSLGFGLRYALRPEDRSNVRADLGWVDGQPGLILHFREAF